MKVLTRHETAAKLGVNVRTVDRLHTQGEGPRRIQLTSRRCGYTDEEVDAWVANRAFASMAAVHAARTGVDADELQDQRSEPRQLRPHAVSSRSSALPAAIKPVPRAARLRSSTEQKRHNRSDM
jgi:predicted DNA-binding transcriptional regulator AlpA